MKNLINSLFVILVMVGCAENQSDQKTFSDKEYSNSIQNLFDFFDNHAYNDSIGVYYSEIDNNGNLLSEKIYTVALNRLIYGLAYMSDDNPDKLIKAKRLQKFQLENLIGADSIGKYSYSYVEKGTPEKSEVLDVWQQAYGLCGLAELYRKSPNKELLRTIHELHSGFIARFHDKLNGGFWGSYHLTQGPQSGSKSLQSLMYPITAYMANLWEVDKDNRELYEPYISDNIELLSKYGWNAENGWVNVKFDDEWQVCKSSELEKPCFTVTPGHNFQLAALLLRTKFFNFIDKEKREHYIVLGKQILERTMQKNIFSNSRVEEGFFSEVNPETNEIIDRRKTWWQHAEAIIALKLGGNDYRASTEKLMAFFFLHFQDFKKGGEFFYLTEHNVPITEELKGSIGKSTYHTIELIRYLREK